MGTKEKLQICILVFALVSLIPEIIALGYTRMSWSQYSDQGRQLISFGDPEAAVKYFQFESRETFKTKGAKSPEYIATLEGLSLAFKKDKMYRSAEEKIVEAKTILDSAFFKDRQKIAHVLSLKADLMEEMGRHSEAVRCLDEIKSLNAWWQWFWTGFFIAFITEALYMANVIAKPGDMELSHLRMEFGYLYIFSVVVGTATMTKGLIMWGGLTFLQAMFAGPGVSLALLPLVFGLVMATSEHWVRENPLNHVKPSREAYR